MWTTRYNNTSGDMSVSKNNGTTKSSIFIGFSFINHPFWGTPIFGNIHIGSSILFYAVRMMMYLIDGLCIQRAASICFHVHVSVCSIKGAMLLMNEIFHHFANTLTPMCSLFSIGTCLEYP